MNNLTTITYNTLTVEEQQEIAKILYEEYNSIIRIGMKFYKESSGIGTIIDIFLKETHNGRQLYVKYEYTSFGKKTISEYSVREFIYFNFNFIYSTEEQFNDDVTALVKGDKTITDLINENFGITKSNTTELMITNKNNVIEKRDELIMKREFVTARYKKMEAVLDAKRRELYSVVNDFKHQLEKVNKLIIQLELYLGVEETIEQIQVGQIAPIDMPISLRQRIMYMDVEVGDPADNGIDISNVEEFDKWLLRVHPYWKKKNYEILIPEEKCIAVFRVRKDNKEYYVSNNPFINALYSADMNGLNKRTYIFIRNGENIYKIWSDLINIGERLFPRKSELEKLFESIRKDNDSYSGKEADGKLHGYKLHFLLIQGLFERTDIFQNSKSINLFDNNVDNSTKVNYIYDDEISTQLPSGIPTFSSWQKKLNSSIEEGTRIYFINVGFNSYTGYSHKKDEIKHRIFKQWFVNDYSYPDNAPDDGIYVLFLEKDKKFIRKEGGQLYIKYVPQKRWHDEYKTTRDKGYSFAIENDDKFILNYDAISYKDMDVLEFYLYTRIGREQYLQYIPLLMKVFQMKKEELTKEQDFVKLILSNIKLEDNEMNREAVMQQIEWWKVKNKWKRSLSSDDAKAFRMISKEMKNFIDIRNEVKRNLEENGY